MTVNRTFTGYLLDATRFYLTFSPACVYNEPMYSVKEAAQKLGLDTSQVRRLLAKGDIKGVKLARDWVVLELNYERKRKPQRKRE